MAETPSTMLPLGTPVPAFRLEDAVTGRMVTESVAADDEALLVMFICNHCPFVKHVLNEIGRVGSEYERRGVAVVAINSNDVRSYPQDGPDRMRELALREDWSFAFLLDGTQEVA